MASTVPEDILGEITDVINVFDKVGDGKLDVNKIIDCLRVLG